MEEVEVALQATGLRTAALWGVGLALIACLVSYVFFPRSAGADEPAARSAGHDDVAAARRPAAHEDERLHVEAKHDDASEWQLAAELGGEQSMTVYTRVRRGELALRFVVTVDASISELIALLREADLYPTWNPYCTEAGILHLESPLELWAYAAFNCWPLPIPPLFAFVHATLKFVATGSYWHLSIASPPKDDPGAPADRTQLPAHIQHHGEVRLSYVSGDFVAVHRDGRPGQQPARTRANVEAALDLTNQMALGPLRFLTPPSWLVNIMTRVMIPGVWRESLTAIANIQAAGESGAIGARLAADATGVYQRIQRASEQST